MYRKVKRWIYDKQQYKGTPSSPKGRRQRHKSMGELEMSSSNMSGGSKSKKHHSSFLTTSEVRLYSHGCYMIDVIHILYNCKHKLLN